MKRWLRRIAAALAVLVVLALLVPLIIIAALQSDQVRALAVDRVLTDVNQELPGTVGIERVDGSLLGHARVHDIHITDARGNLAAQIETATVDFQMLPVIGGSIIVDEINAHGVTAVARTYDDEVLNWDLVVEPDPEPVVDPFDWPVYVDAINLSDTSVAYLDETVELDDEIEGLADWRSERIRQLDDAITAHDIRQGWNAGFAPEQLAAIAEPRAPVGLWATDIETSIEFAMRGHDMEARIGEMTTDLHADILPRSLPTTVDDIDVVMTTSTVSASIGAVNAGGWLQGGELTTNVIQPTLQRQIDAWDAGEPLDEAFERVTADLGWWSVGEGALLWAAPDVPLTSPITFTGDVALDEQTLVLDAEVDHEDAVEPVVATVEMTDYDAEEPGYSATVEAPQFELHQWVLDPEMPSVETSALLRVDGVGFDPETLEADIRIRLDDTLIDETYAAEMLYAAANVEDGVIDGYNIGALTPYLDLIGAVRVDMDGEATARIRTTAETAAQRHPNRDPGAVETERAELALDLNAVFDPDFQDVDQIEDVLISLDTTADWDFAGLAAEEIRVGDSSGELDLALWRTGAAPGEYRGNYTVDASAAGIRFPDHAVDRFEIRDRGNATVRMPIDEPLEAIRNFENNARLSASGVRIPEGDLDSARVAMALQRDNEQTDRINAQLDANLRGLRSTQLNASRLELDYDGDLTAGDQLLVDRLRGDGTFAAQGLSNQDFSAQSVSGQFDSDVRLTTGAIPLDTIDAELTVETGQLTTPDVTVASSQTELTGIIAVAAPGRPANPSQARVAISADGIETDDVTVGSADAGFDGRFQLVDADMPVSRVDARLTADLADIAADAVTVDAADADFHADVALTDAVDPLDMIGRFAISGDGAASGIDAPDFDAATDAVELTVDLRGTTDDPTGELAVDTEAINYGDERVESVTAALTLLDERRRGRIAVDVQRRRDQRLGAETGFAFEPDYEAGELHGLKIETDRATWSSTPESVLRWTGERAEFDNVLFSSDDQSLFVDGHFHPEVDQNIDATVDIGIETLIHDLYLNEFVPDLPDIAGAVEAELMVVGTATAPVLEVAGQLDRLFYDGIGPFAAVVDADYDDQRLQLRNLEADAFDEPLLEASASLPIALDLADGDYEFFVDRHSDVWARVHPRQLRDFHEIAPELNQFGIDGVIDVEFDASGTIALPHLDLDGELRNFRMQGEIGDDFINLRDFNIFTELDYAPTAAGGEGLDFDTRVVWDEETAAEMGATTPFPFEEWLVAVVEEMEEPDLWRQELLQLPFELYARIPSLDLEQIPLQQLRDENLAGHAELDVAADGTIGEPEGHIELAVDDLGWGMFREIAFQLDAGIGDEIAQFEHMQMTWGDDDVFTGQGSVPLPITTWLAGETVSDLPIDFQWELHELQLSRLSAVDYTFARVDGHIEAFLELGGSIRSPEFAVQGGVFDTQLGDAATGTARLAARGADDRVNLSGSVSRGDDTYAAFEGSAPIDLDILGWDDELEHPWQSPGDLEFAIDTEPIPLEEFVPPYLYTDFFHDPEGLLRIQAAIDGTWEQITARGLLEFDDGAVTVPELGRGFEDITARVELDEDQLQIEQFQLHDGPSSVEMTGRVEHELLIPDFIDLQMEADEFNLVGLGVDFPMFVSAEADASGDLLGDPGEMNIHVTGLEVVLTDEWDRMLHDRALDPDIVLLDRHQPDPMAELVDEDPDDIDGLNLQANITVDRDAWGRHPMGDVNFEADLTADITGDLVAIHGSVDAIRGQLEFLGRRFTVQPSEVLFTGGIPPNPRLQLEAHHMLDRAITQALGPPTTGDPRVEILITGSAEEPRMELRADPAMTDTEILFVLMTGRPPDRTDIGREEGVASQALAAVSGVFFGMLQDELAGTVPVDVLRLEPRAAGARGGRLEVGSYLTNDLFFAYQRQFGADEHVPGNIFRLEYHFLPRWMGEFVYTDRNEGELNFYWDVF